MFTRVQTTLRQTSLPLAPLSKLPGDRLHWVSEWVCVCGLRTDRAFPWDWSPGYRLRYDRQAFPWHLSQSYQETDYIEWVCVLVCVCMIKNRQSLPLGLFTRVQTALRQTSLPLAPLSKLPGDRLHWVSEYVNNNNNNDDNKIIIIIIIIIICVSVCAWLRTESSPGIGHQGTDCAKTDKPSPGTSLKVARRQTTLSESVCVLVC